ncbi:MAG: 6,7-dimethyl-8-ribityllumazine synthase [Alcaligenaceae bacterium]|nr:6,7-dimethyl-8-ribityllumazine synthase [Alcaligenaceae bacterium]
MSTYTIESDMNGEGMHIGIVRSRWNEDIGLEELGACITRLLELGVSEDAIMVIEVPGALEAGFALSQLALSDQFDALIALGAVIRGETYHFEVVSNESASAITRVSLDTGVPIANGILTTNTEEEALARAVQKGIDCAEVAVEMTNLAMALIESDDDFDDELFEDEEE